MVDALATSRAQQRQLVTDASHEFRTPLTSLTTNLELLDHFDALPADDRPEVLAALRADAAELTHLASDLVELATDRAAQEAPVGARLSELVLPVVERARRRSARRIDLLTAPTRDDADDLIMVRPQMIQRAAGNLIENAVKYAPDGPIVVRVSHDSVEVLDEGPGIDDADAEHVFERFWRADQARALPGSGLGLSIVARIVEQHDGSVWATRRPEGGAAVGFRVSAATGITTTAS
jgi:two-component system sensor histidine kinase MprB